MPLDGWGGFDYGRGRGVVSEGDIECRASQGPRPISNHMCFSADGEPSA